MGRRKIEIKAIKDDRNRSVTFLKRKGGLFKKAHELSVLCSVDVAVIIFGSNKKLYEFSSGDIHQTLQRYHYSQPHEHKGPQDFADKDGGDEDEDDDAIMGTPPQDNPSPPHHGIVQHPLPDQPQLQHMRHRSTPSASPPMVNGGFPPQRLSTPQPHHAGSRPSSRNHVRRQSSNLVPQNHPNPHATQNLHQQANYVYQTPPPYAHPHQQAAYMRAHQGTPPMHTPPMQQHHFSHPPPQTQMQHLYLQDQRRQSMPPNIPVHTQQEHAQPAPMMHTPPQPSRPFQSPPLPGPSPQRLPQQQHQPDQPHGLGVMHGQPPLDVRPNQHNQQQWVAQGSDLAERSQSRSGTKEEESLSRPQSIDMTAATRHESEDAYTRYGPNPPGSAPIRPTHHAPTGSAGSMPAPSRVNSLQSTRPKLSVQIPGEAADETQQPGVDESSRETSKTNSTPAKPGSSETTHHSNLVLPAPSPRSASAGAVLSAGATGPTNPFARPNIPKKQENNSDVFKDASPMSALPSRVMQEHGYMSSPSSMFPEWGLGPMHGNTLASPAVYQPTPINYHGPSFRDEPSDKRKKSPDDDEGGTSKKPKSG